MTHQRGYTASSQLSGWAKDAYAFLKGDCTLFSLRWKKTVYLLIFPFPTESTFTAFRVFALSFWSLVCFSLLFPQCSILPFLLTFPEMALFLHWILFLASELFACVYRESRYVCKWTLAFLRNMIFKGLDCGHFAAFFTSNISLGKLLPTECCKGPILLSVFCSHWTNRACVCVKLGFQIRVVWSLQSYVGVLLFCRFFTDVIWKWSSVPLMTIWCVLKYRS